MGGPPQPLPGAVPWQRFGKVALCLVLGIVAGFIGLTRGCASPAQAGGVSQERYAVVVSTLFAEGESLRVINDYLPALNSTDPVAYLSRLADRYAKSGDRMRQRQAEDLRRLAQALSSGVADDEPAATPPRPPAVAPDRQPSSTIPATSATPAVVPAMGVVKSDDGGVRLRAEPSTTSPALGLLAAGTRVEILNVVDGQAVSGNEKRWYKVRSGQAIGYVYFQYLAPAD